MHYVVFPLKIVLDAGFKVASMHSFMNSAKCMEVIQKNAVWYHLPLERYLYVPFGFVWMAMCMNQWEKITDRKRKVSSTDAQMSTTIWIPHFDVDTAAACDKDVMDETFKCNIDYLEKERENHTYSAVREFMGKFQKDVLAKRGDATSVVAPTD